MKRCQSCGSELGERETYCSVCGFTYTPQKLGVKITPTISDNVTGTIEDIEKKVLNYYINNKLRNKTGNYVVLHNETTVSNDVCKVTVRYLSTPDTFSNTYVATVSVNMKTGDVSIDSTPRENTSKGNSVSLRNVFCIGFSIIAMIAWLFAPLFSFWRIEVTSLELLKAALSLDEITAESALFCWMLIGIFICIIVCIVSLSRKGTSAKTSSIICICIMLFLLFIFSSRYQENSLIDLSDFTGAGYWVTLVFMTLVAFVSEKIE